MWKLIGALLLNFVFITKQSVEKPLIEGDLPDDDFITNLRGYLKDGEDSDTLIPRFADFEAQKTTEENQKRNKTPFKFTAKYKQFRLASTSSTVKFNCSTNDPLSTYRLIHELAMPPYIKKTVVPDGVKFVKDGAIFFLKNPALQDGGKYYCVAKNRRGKEIKHQPIFLFVTNQIFPNVRPSINPPVSYSEFGDDVTFTCQARGLGYTLKWEVKDENGIFVEVPAEVVSERPTRNNQGYVIQGIRLNLEDLRPPPFSQTYRCCLNFQGDLRYAYARLEIKAPERPNITNLPSYIGITEGSDFEFKCHATGSPPPVIMWSKDGDILENCKKDILDDNDDVCHITGQNYIISGEHHEVLRLERVSETNSGKIVCHALNVAGMDEDTTTIRVYEDGYIPNNHHEK